MCIRDSFGSLEQAQCHLDKVCDRLNGEASNMSAQEKKERVHADIAALRPLDHGDMGCFEQRLSLIHIYMCIRDRCTAVANQMIMVTENKKHLERIPNIEIENWVHRG